MLIINLAAHGVIHSWGQSFQDQSLPKHLIFQPGSLQTQFPT